MNEPAPSPKQDLEKGVETSTSKGAIKPGVTAAAQMDIEEMSEMVDDLLGVGADVKKTKTVDDWGHYNSFVEVSRAPRDNKERSATFKKQKS